MGEDAVEAMARRLYQGAGHPGLQAWVAQDERTRAYWRGRARMAWEQALGSLEAIAVVRDDPDGVRFIRHATIEVLGEGEGGEAEAPPPSSNR